jgi:hypothetical protein
MSRLCDIDAEMTTAVLLAVMVLMPFTVGLIAAGGVTYFRNRGKK